MNEYYVYELIDPRNGLSFYVGKGKNDRMYDHERDTINKKLFYKNRYLFFKIRKILTSGLSIKYNKILENIDEKTALAEEIIQIKNYGRKNNGTGILCNMTDGGEGTSGYIVSKDMRLTRSNKQKEYLNKNPDAKKKLIDRLNKIRFEATKKSIEKISKTYSIVDINDKIITITNLNGFSKLNNLSPSKMWKLVSGRKNKYRGYKNLEYFNGGMKRKIL